MNLERLYDKITKHEGVRRRLYDDATSRDLGQGDTIQGHPTIGIGFALDVIDFPADIARLWLTRIVAQRVSALRSSFDWFDHLDGVRQEVIVDMSYQLGIAGFGKFHKMIAAIEERNWQEAKAQMLDSDVARQCPNRYRELADTIETGVWA